MMRTPSSSALPSFEPAPGPAATKSVFFETLDAALPPAAMIASCAPSRVYPSSEPVATTVSPASTPPAVRRGARARVPGRRALHARGRPAVDDLAVPVDLEPVDQRVGDDRRRRPRPRRARRGDAARIASSDPNHCASARAATGPTWRMLSATRKRHSSFVFASSRLASSSSADFDRTDRSSPSNGPSGSNGASVFLRCRRNGRRGCPACRPRAAAAGRSRHPARRRRSGRGPRARARTAPPRSRAAARSGRTGWVSAAAATSPSPSMSSAPREPMCSTRPRTCAGQDRAFGQRRSMSPSFAGAQRRAALGAVRRA